MTESESPETDADRDVDEAVADAHVAAEAVEDGAGQDVAGQDVAGHDADARDAASDERVARLDDGGSVLAAPDALPFDMPSRERFAALAAIAPTGEARVDAATARLEEIPDLPTSDHVEVYDDVHKRLQDALSDTEVR